MVGFYNYTVIATYIGMLTGLAGIYCACNGKVTEALIALLVCGVIDCFDGRIARTRKRTLSEQRFGIEIDSLSDLVTFGILPAALCASQTEALWIKLAAGLYALCALIRLAYFNVLAEEKLMGENLEGPGYIGLPVTSSAWLTPLLFCFTPLLKNSFSTVYGIFMLALAALFVSPFKLKKPGSKCIAPASVVGLCMIAVLLWEGSRGYH